MVYQILLVLEVILAVTLVALVLIQQGKGADAGAAFGSGASGTVFGSSGAGNFLTRMTSVLAFLFMLNSLGLAYLISHRTDPNIDAVESVIDTVGEATSVSPSDVPVDADVNTGSITDDVPTGATPSDVPGAGAVESLKDGATDAMNSAQEAVESGADTVSGAVEKAKDAVQEGAATAVEKAKDAATDAVEKIIPTDVPQ